MPRAVRECVPAAVAGGRKGAGDLVRWRAGCGGSQVRVYVALLHYPVYNRHGHVVCSAITNLDVHDIARAARTYGVRGFYVVTPLEDQRRLLERLLAHWREGYGALTNPERKAALELVTVVASLPEAVARITGEAGRRPDLLGTGATATKPNLTYQEARARIHRGQPTVILFGTGWGLTRDVLRLSTCLLPPIRGATSYNHLSVRGAAAIILDRLLGLRDETLVDTVNAENDLTLGQSPSQE